MSEVTVTEHLLMEERLSPHATGQFTTLLNDLILSAKIIARSVSKAGLLDVLGGTGEVNIQGENIQKLDEFANHVLIYRMARSGVICAMGSEENADLIHVSEDLPRGDYILIFDPLDGSSNIDVNINVGTIFSILRRKQGVKGPVMLEEVLQPGMHQVGAGYVLYGPSTMLIFTTGHGVHGFTLDPSVGEFLLSHKDMRIPEEGKIYSVNEGNWPVWDRAAQECVTYFKNSGTERQRPYSMRYVGSLVADFHRTLLYGGIFMYPPDKKNTHGKLRLMCEASPLAMVVEQAGGKAIDGRRRILELLPEKLHARVPLFIGSSRDVDAVAEIYTRHG